MLTVGPAGCPSSWFSSRFLSFGPKQPLNGCFASESNPPHSDSNSHSHSERALRCWSQSPVGCVVSIRPHTRNRTQGEWSQRPYEPPGAGAAHRPRVPHRLPHSHSHSHTNAHSHSAAGPKQRSEASFLFACTSKTTHKGTGPKHRTNLPAPGPRPRHVDVDRPV